MEVKAYTGPTVFRVSEPVSVFRVEDDGSSDGSPGSLRWKTPGIEGDVDGAPAVGFNNDIYIGSTSQKLYAYSPEGTQNPPDPELVPSEVWSFPFAVEILSPEERMQRQEEAL